MFKKLSVNQVLGVFTRTIADLREVGKNNRDLAEAAAERIKVDLVTRDATLSEAERAERLANKLFAIVDDNTPRAN
jgi:hypothetical protein